MKLIISLDISPESINFDAWSDSLPPGTEGFDDAEDLLEYIATQMDSGQMKVEDVINSFDDAIFEYSVEA